MSNLINRQDAIEAILTWDKFGVDNRSQVVRWYEGLEPYVKLRDVIWAIENLPPAESEPSDVARDISRIIENEIDMRVIAQSERKKGEWLDTETSYADGVRQECRCSVCTRLSLRPLGDYCRWCGADMRGEI